jgi:ATP synthase protein I
MRITSSQPQSRTPGPAPAAPFAAMLRGALIPTVCTAPVIVVVFWVARQTRGGLAALLGVCVALVFFAGGLYVMKRVTNANPISVLAGALAVYFGQVLFLGLVIISLSSADWLDGQAFGLSILAVALVWQLAQVVAFLRLRQPVYDEAAIEECAGPADESGDSPGDEPAQRRLV